MQMEVLWGKTFHASPVTYLFMSILPDQFIYLYSKSNHTAAMKPIILIALSAISRIPQLRRVSSRCEQPAGGRTVRWHLQ